ncbi:MAG: universal stress protein [Chloroflexota bacterium]|nr:universal stress protein [Chloroflexota bacterium]
MYDSILVPLDGSSLAEQALTIAHILAQRSGATLRLVHVHNPYHPIYMEGLPVVDEQLQPLHELHERTYLEKLRDRLQNEAHIEIIGDLLDGPIAQTLAAHATSSGSDLIVMTTHGYSGFERLWLGSIAETLVRLSPVPLLLRRLHADAPADSVPFTCRQILIPLDGSAAAEQILLPALRFGRTMGATFRLLHIIDPSVPPGARALPSMGEMRDDSTEARQTAAEMYLQKAAQQLRDQGVQVETQIETHKRPAVAIMECAEQHNMDLIAMATHGRGGLQRLLLGSVSDKVLRGSDLPLLLYRPRDGV